VRFLPSWPLPGQRRSFSSLRGEATVVSSFWEILSEGLGRIKDGMDVEPDVEVLMRVT